MEPARWLGSLLLAAIFTMAHLPAALLLGPMLAGIVLSSNGARIGVPRRPSMPPRPSSAA
jgi:uncharacterized membrane protein AbrB (regulator of aidB expression)